jgi:hypothetical protein
MTDEEIRDIFVELRRVGVDLERPPGLALGTGFREGEFSAWLRTLPDALGHDAFVERLDGHLMAAAPPPPRPTSQTAETARTPSDLECATLEQLEAAIHVLTEEWDPLCARLGKLSSEDVEQFAFDIMNAILGLAGAGADVEKRVAKMIGSLEEHEFGVRPSPVQQRRYLARRLMRVVVDHPSPPTEPDFWKPANATDVETKVPTHTEHSGNRQSVHATTRSNRVSLGPRGDEPPALDPNAVCTECGITGTVAVVIRDREPAISRYCIDCWRGVRDRYVKLTPPPDTSTPQGTIAVFDYMRSMMRERRRYAASALWEDLPDFTRAVIAANEDETAARDERHLQQLASDLLAQAPKMYGPMPPEIEAFVRDHTSPPA